MLWISSRLCFTSRCVSSNAYSRFIADTFEVRSFEEIKPQGKGMDMKVGDPEGPSSPAPGKETKKFPFSPTIERKRASGEDEVGG
jgi:hypothetical protein